MHPYFTPHETDQTGLSAQSCVSVTLASQLKKCAPAAIFSRIISIIMQYVEPKRGFYKHEYMFPDKGDNIYDKQPLSRTSVRLFLPVLNNA